MKLSEKQRIFTYNVACLIQYAYDVCGIELTMGEAWRTKDQVLLNYYGYGVRKSLAGGLYLEKIDPVSWTLNSRHPDRLAIDFNFFKNGELTYKYEDIKPLGDYWVSLHPKNRWGGDFNKNGIDDDRSKDIPHFEMQK